MKKLIFLFFTSLFLFSSTYALTACEELLTHECYGQEERCEFTVTTSNSYDLKDQGGDYGQLYDGITSPVDSAAPTRAWVDLREIQTKYTESYHGENYIYEYKPCGDDECDVMPIRRMRMTLFTNRYFDWLTWSVDTIGHIASGNDGSGDSGGAINADVREGFLAKFRVCFKNEEPDESNNPEMRDFLKRGSYSMLDDYINNRNPWLIYVDSGQTAGGYNCANVILDGDEGDYISIDPNGKNKGIATFVVDMSKPDGTDWRYETTYDDHDYNNDEEISYLHLMGYENKNYLALREQCDQEEAAEEAAEALAREGSPQTNDITIILNEGTQTTLSVDDMSDETLKEIRLFPEDANSNYFGNIANNVILPDFSNASKSLFGYSIFYSYDLISSEEINEYKIKDNRHSRAYNTENRRSTPIQVATYIANKATEYGDSSFSDAKNIKVIIQDTNVPIFSNGEKLTDLNENTDTNRRLYGINLEDLNLCSDPDSTITYNFQQIISDDAGIINGIPTIQNNILKLYLNPHKHSSDVKLKIRCTEEFYNKNVDSFLNLSIIDVPENISIVGAVNANPEENYLGKIYLSASEGTTTTYEINIENWDDNNLDNDIKGRLQTTGAGNSYTIKSIDNTKLEFEYIAQNYNSGKDNFDIDIKEERVNKKLAVEFSISDTNSAISWNVEEINISGTEDNQKIITLEDFTGKFTDNENDGISRIEIDGSLPSGSSFDENSNNITIVPNKNDTGIYSFKVYAYDTNSDSQRSNNPVNVSVKFNPVNDAPIISFDSNYELNENGILEFSLNEDSQGTISFDIFDIDNEIEELTLVLSEYSDNLEITITENTIKIEPTENYFTETYETIYIGVTDGDEESSYLTLNLNIIPVNDLPQGVNKSVSIYRDSYLDLKSDFFEIIDIDNDDLNSIQISTLPKKGDFILNNEDIVIDQEISLSDISNIKYIPDKSYIGNDSFLFRVSDGTGLSKSNAFNISVLESPFGENSQIASKGGVPIPNKQFGDWSCKSGYIPKQDSVLQSYTCVVPENKAPSAKISILPKLINNSLRYNSTVYLSGEGSTDEEGGTLEYYWKILSNSTDLEEDGSSSSSKFEFIANNDTCEDNKCKINLTVIDEPGSERSKSNTVTLTFNLIETEVEITPVDYSNLTIKLYETYNDDELEYLGLKRNQVIEKNKKLIQVNLNGTIIKYEDVEAVTSEPADKNEQKFIVGDGLCSKYLGENTVNSPEDCKQKSSGFGILVIFTFLILLGIGGFVAWKKGLFSKLSSPTKSFASTDSYSTPTYQPPSYSTTSTTTQNPTIDLRSLVQEKISEGYSSGEIKSYLISKGYSESEIDNSLNS